MIHEPVYIAGPESAGFVFDGGRLLVRSAGRLGAALFPASWRKLHARANEGVFATGAPICRASRGDDGSRDVLLRYWRDGCQTHRVVGRTGGAAGGIVAGVGWQAG